VKENLGDFRKELGAQYSVKSGRHDISLCSLMGKVKKIKIKLSVVRET
jgi:hypothetical protein